MNYAESDNFLISTLDNISNTSDSVDTSNIVENELEYVHPEKIDSDTDTVNEPVHEVKFISNWQATSYVSRTNHDFTYLWFNTEFLNSSMYADVLSEFDTYSVEEPEEDIYSSLRITTDEFEDNFENRLNLLPNFKIRRRSSISTFFSTNMIDIPRCLKTSYSLYKPIYELPHLKLLNILMRHGMKEKIFTTVFKIFVKNALHPKLESTDTRNVRSWLSLLPVFNSSLLTDTSIYVYFRVNKLKYSNFNYNINSHYLNTTQSLTMSSFLLNHLEQYKPTFIFKVQKVDKTTRKHSRGKSGKYVVLWKYVPVYKRFYAVLRWLIQDIDLQKAYKFELKFWQALNSVLNKSSSSLIIRFRNFNHNFVFKNFKKTLLKTLYTVS